MDSNGLHIAQESHPQKNKEKTLWSSVTGSQQGQLHWKSRVNWIGRVVAWESRSRQYLVKKTMIISKKIGMNDTDKAIKQDCDIRIRTRQITSKSTHQFIQVCASVMLHVYMVGQIQP